MRFRPYLAPNGNDELTAFSAGFQRVIVWSACLLALLFGWHCPDFNVIFHSCISFNLLTSKRFPVKCNLIGGFWTAVYDRPANHISPNFVPSRSRVRAHTPLLLAEQSCFGVSKTFAVYGVSVDGGD
jgi:hypothetical protein